MLNVIHQADKCDSRARAHEAKGPLSVRMRLGKPVRAKKQGKILHCTLQRHLGVGLAAQQVARVQVADRQWKAVLTVAVETALCSLRPKCRWVPLHHSWGTPGGRVGDDLAFLASPSCDRL